MYNFPVELSIDDIQMSTTVRRQRRASFSAISLLEYDNNLNKVASEKNKRSTTLLVQKYQDAKDERKVVDVCH